MSKLYSGPIKDAKAWRRLHILQSALPPAVIVLLSAAAYTSAIALPDGAIGSLITALCAAGAVVALMAGIATAGAKSPAQRSHKRALEIVAKSMSLGAPEIGKELMGLLTAQGDFVTEGQMGAFESNLDELEAAADRRALKEAIALHMADDVARS